MREKMPQPGSPQGASDLTHLWQHLDLWRGNWHGWIPVTGQVPNSTGISKPIPNLWVQGQGKLAV